MDDAQGAGVDLHHIEAGAGVRVPVGLQVSLGGPGEKETLLGRDGVPGQAVVRPGTGLDLREDQDSRPPLGAVAPVPIQYAAAVEKEIPGGQPFPPPARVHGTKWPMKLRRWMGQGPYSLRAAICSAVP